MYFISECGADTFSGSVYDERDVLHAALFESNTANPSIYVKGTPISNMMFKLVSTMRLK